MGALAVVWMVCATAEPEPLPEQRPRLLKAHSLWPGLAGGLLGASGIGLVSLAVSIEGGIRSGSSMFQSVAELERAISTGRALELTGWTVIGLGLALVVTAIAIVVFGEGR